MPSPIRDLIHARIREQLEQHRVVVWYDVKRAFGPVFDAFQHAALAKVDARTSMLTARRQTDEHWAVLTHPDPELRSCQAILIYVPWSRGKERRTASVSRSRSMRCSARASVTCRAIRSRRSPAWPCPLGGRRSIASSPSVAS